MKLKYLIIIFFISINFLFCEEEYIVINPNSPIYSDYEKKEKIGILKYLSNVKLMKTSDWIQVDPETKTRFYYINDKKNNKLGWIESKYCMKQLYNDKNYKIGFSDNYKLFKQDLGDLLKVNEDIFGNYLIILKNDKTYKYDLVEIYESYFSAFFISNIIVKNYNFDDIDDICLSGRKVIWIPYSETTDINSMDILNIQNDVVTKIFNENYFVSSLPPVQNSQYYYISNSGGFINKIKEIRLTIDGTVSEEEIYAEIDVINYKWDGLKYEEENKDSFYDEAYLIDDVKVYKDPNIKSNVVMQLKKGTKIIPVESKNINDGDNKKNNIWFCIAKKFDDIGWINGLKVNFMIDNIISIAILTPKISNLRLRDAPSLSGNFIRFLNMGEKLRLIEIGNEETINGDKGNWVKVKTEKGETGWCFDAYLEELKE